MLETSDKRQFDFPLLFCILYGAHLLRMTTAYPKYNCWILPLDELLISYSLCVILNINMSFIPLLFYDLPFAAAEL